MKMITHTHRYTCPSWSDGCECQQHDLVERPPMSRSEFHAGETVDVTVRGARVLESRMHDELPRLISIDLPAGDMITLDPDADYVTVRPRTPADGEPKPGEIWRDAHGDLWYAINAPHLVEVISALGERLTANRLNTERGPIHLVWAECGSDPEEPTA